MLDGFELAAAAWERSVLPARVDGYDPAMLDLLCLGGEVGWARFSPPSAELTEPAHLTPATAIALFLRENSEAWQALAGGRGRSRAQTHRQRQAGAGGTAFARGIVFQRRAGRERPRCRSDTPERSGHARRQRLRRLRRILRLARACCSARQGARSCAIAGRPLPDAGASSARRGSLRHRAPPSKPRRGRCCGATAWSFRRLLTRENIAAPWRDLARVYRRLEARGEIRGGHFVAGMSGEQFAMPRAIERLREVRRTPATAGSSRHRHRRSAQPCRHRDLGRSHPRRRAQPGRLPRRRAHRRARGRHRPHARSRSIPPPCTNLDRPPHRGAPR